MKIALAPINPVIGSLWINLNKIIDMIEAARKGELLEMFGAGTAVVISPILGFSHQNETFELPKVENSYASIIKKRITDIQRNKAEDKFGWRYLVKE